MAHMGKVLAMQVQGPEFGALPLTLKQARGSDAPAVPVLRGEIGGSSEFSGQLF